ncbi:MAG: TIR domain-containing protein [Mycolicibacterium sp.]|uniref:TIR domain-containing protein n=1 Tax=Mycolicibacterium sp. TaxID=2320850 RepID=UPI000FB8E856|nr:TIR domain-containing protein [Mycolicibacterium sp.]RUP32987.1 MAG: TIR domain-containing protein [Mycolicibacterium sp.]
MAASPGDAACDESKVFISHASADARAAIALVDDLERAGISCWIAPRDILPGRDYATEIVNAIRRSSVVLLLVSAHSNQSEHCLRELEIAVNADAKLLPLRLDSAPLSPGFEYRLSTIQWTTLTGNAGSQGVAATLVTMGASARTVSPPDVDIAKKAQHRDRRATDLSVLAGRTTERKTIAQTLTDIAETGRGRFLLIGGESGVGKTALTRELVRLADDYEICSTTCGSFVETVSFYPIREILRQLLESNDLLREVQHLYGNNSIQATMAAVVDSPVASPEARREAMVGTFTNLVVGSHTSRDSKPLLLVIDDAENIDSGSVDSLLCLLARLDEAPVLATIIFRSDTVETAGRSHPLVPLIDATRRDAMRGAMLQIGPLRRADYPAVVEAILGGRLRASSQLLDYLWAETEGNALFLREIIHAVRAFSAEPGPREASLVFRDGEWRFMGTVDALQTPKSVEDAIARNLDGIGADDRGYLELAAVIGKQFGFDVALGISGTDENELLDSLENSIGRSIIRELTEPADSFEFSHSKIRDVLYNSLSNIRRKRIHSRIADLMAEITDRNTYSDRDALIGEHLYLAARYAQAADYLIRSADRLMAVSESRRAAQVYERAIISLEKSINQSAGAVEWVDPRVARAELGRIQALAQTSEYRSARKLCRKVIASSAIDVDRGWAYDHLGDIEWATGNIDAALSAYTAAEDIALSSGDTGLELEVCADLAELHEREAERTAGLDRSTSGAHRISAEKYLERQYRLATASSDPWARARAFRNHAKRLRRSGDISGALQEYEASLQQTDARVATHSVLISYAKTLRLCGEVDRAREVVDRVLGWSQQTGARRSRAIALYYRAMLTLSDQGPTDDARDDIESALTLHEEIGYNRGQWEVRILKGEWLSQRGDWPAAVEEFRIAVGATNEHTDAQVVAAAVDTLRAVDESQRAEVLENNWSKH